jgi:hypothetical protein
MTQRNTPVVHALAASLVNALAQSGAIVDNCWEDQAPLDPEAASALRSTLAQIERNLTLAQNWAGSEAQPRPVGVEP